MSAVIDNFMWIGILFGLILLAIDWFRRKKTASATAAPLSSASEIQSPEEGRVWWMAGVRNALTRPLHRFLAIPDEKTGVITKGYFLGPISAHFWFAIIILTISLGIALLMAGLVAPLNPDVFLRPVVFWTIVLGPAVIMNLTAWTFTKRRTVPNNHALPLKVLGRVINVMLINGEYRIPLYPFLAPNEDNVTGDVVEGSQENKDDNPGLIYVGAITVHLGREGQGGKGLMEAAAFDKAVVGIRPTMTYTCDNPVQRLGRNRPVKDLNEAARDAVRRALASTTTADQANDLQGAIAKMIAGKGFYAVRTRKSDAGSGVHGGNLVTDATTGRILCEVRDHQEENVDTKEKLAQVVMLKGTPALRNAALNSAGQLEPFFVNIASAFKRALAENGYVLTGEPRIGEIELPEQVSTAAANAAAEVPQRAAALADAETSRQAGLILTSNETGLNGADAAWAGLAQNGNNVKVVVVPGLGQQNGGGVIINSN
jgi:hypothetical protein